VHTSASKVNHLGFHCWIIVMLTAVFFSGRSDTTQPIQTQYIFSFESGLEGWSAKGTDLNTPPVEWSIAPTEEQKYEG